MEKKMEQNIEKYGKTLGIYGKIMWKHRNIMAQWRFVPRKTVGNHGNYVLQIHFYMSFFLACVFIFGFGMFWWLNFRQFPPPRLAFNVRSWLLICLGLDPNPIGAFIKEIIHVTTTFIASWLHSIHPKASPLNIHPKMKDIEGWDHIYFFHDPIHPIDFHGIHIIFSHFFAPGPVGPELPPRSAIASLEVGKNRQLAKHG